MTRAIAIALLLSTVGCARTMSQTIAAKDSGMVRMYARECEAVWPWSIRVFHDHGAGAIEEHKDLHYMASQSSMDFWSAGMFMVAWLEPADNQCRVTVATKRRVAIDAVSHLSEFEYHTELSKHLGVEPPPADERGRWR